VSEVRLGGERRHLMNDDVRARACDRFTDRRRVQPVDDNGCGAECAQQANFVGAACSCDDGMTARHEQGQEPAADRAGRSREKDLHLSARPLSKVGPETR
jgi:hypothetical protein